MYNYKSKIYLLIALGIVSLSLIVDGLIVELPEWVKITAAAISVIFLIYHFVLSRKNKQ